MTTPILPISPSGDNVFKFLVTLSIGLIAFNLLYPRDKSLEIKQLSSEHKYQIDLLKIKLEPIRKNHEMLTEAKTKLESYKKANGEYPVEARMKYDSLYAQFGSQVDEINVIEAELDHKQRLIDNLNVQLNYYQAISTWTFVPAIILFSISLFFWIRFDIKRKKE